MLNATVIISCVSACVAIAAVIVSAISIRSARKTALTGAYFSEMTLAYSAFLACASDFCYHRGLPERDALTSAYFRLSLFASASVCLYAKSLYHFLLDWAEGKSTPGVPPGDMIEECQQQMVLDIEYYRLHGEHPSAEKGGEKDGGKNAPAAPADQRR